MTPLDWRKLDEAHRGRLPRPARIADAVKLGQRRMVTRLLVSYAAAVLVVGALVVAALIARTGLHTAAESAGLPTGAGNGAATLPRLSSSEPRTPGSTETSRPTPRRTTTTRGTTTAADLPAPEGLQAIVDDQGGVTVSWTPSTDQRVVSYQVFRDGTLVHETAKATWTDLPGPGTHSYAVRATDGSGSFSPRTDSLTVEVPQSPALPDLVVDLIQGVDGVFLTVSNVGEAAAPPSTVELFGGQGGLIDVEYLDAGATSAAIQVEDCTTDATVDPANAIAEQSEGNNQSQTLPSCPD